MDLPPPRHRMVGKLAHEAKCRHRALGKEAGEWLVQRGRREVVVVMAIDSNIVEVKSINPNWKMYGLQRLLLLGCAIRLWNRAQSVEPFVTLALFTLLAVKLLLGQLLHELRFSNGNNQLGGHLRHDWRKCHKIAVGLLAHPPIRDSALQECYRGARIASGGSKDGSSKRGCKTRAGFASKFAPVVLPFLWFL